MEENFEASRFYVKRVDSLRVISHLAEDCRVQGRAGGFCCVEWNCACHSRPA